MGDVGIESTLVLDGLAVSKVRFYSTLDSDVGKRVEITDKFNHSNVFTGTFDASLNLLYDLPAFTSYEVKMYGLDGETVESDQTFMLKGYDYLEKNIGLNKNSFAGIKAIVDQGLENSMLEVGYTWVEDDGADDGGHTVQWVITAIDYQGYDAKNYAHNVMVSRKQALAGMYDLSSLKGGGAEGTAPLNTYYHSLPSRIKDCLTGRKAPWWLYNETVYYADEIGYVYLLHPGEIFGNANVTCQNITGGIAGQGSNPQHPYFGVSNMNKVSFDYSGNPLECWTRGCMYTNTNTRDWPIVVNGVGTPAGISSYASLRSYRPSMMIASDPI